VVRPFSKILTDPAGTFLAAVSRRAASSGTAGWHDDDLAFTRDWGFDLAEIERPVEPPRESWRLRGVRGRS
jgi:hypothetical protein